jgi:arginine/ornithine N-succinyltransferase beta subunit
MLRRVTDPDEFDADAPTRTYLVAAANEHKFRAITVDTAPIKFSDSIALPPAALRALQVEVGDSVLCVKI